MDCTVTLRRKIEGRREPQLMRPIQDWPLWSIGIVMMVLMSAAMQAGYLAGRRIYPARQTAATRLGMGYIVTASLALLGLLLAFTFGASEQRYEARRQLVTEEADALASAYVYVLTLPNGANAAVAPLVLQYGRSRVAFFEALDEPTAVQADARSFELEDAIWAGAVANLRAGGAGTTASTVMDRLDRLFEIDSTRRAEHYSRVPLGTLQALMVFSIISAAIIGMALAGGSRHYVASTAFLAVLATTACLILGLDRQRSPSMLAQQAPMERALARIERWEKARIARGAPAPPAGKTAQ
jgi:hypothetical protein